MIPKSGNRFSERDLAVPRTGGIASFRKVGKMIKNNGLLGALAVISSLVAGSIASAQDIPAGWSVDTQPKRAVLTYAPEANGPRYLIVACLRDSEEIGIYSTGIAA